MSCAYHKREFIEITGTVGKNTEVYNPQMTKKIFGVDIVWEQRWNVLVTSMNMHTSKMVFSDVTKSPDFDGKSLKTYRFHEKQNPQVGTIVMSNRTPKSGDLVRMYIVPTSSRVNTRRFCVMSVEIL